METSLWGKVKIRLSQALEKSEEITKLSSKKMEIAGLEYKIEKALTNLGGHVYEYLVEKNKKQITKSKEFTEKLNTVKELHKLLDKKEKELKKI